MFELPLLLSGFFHPLPVLLLVSGMLMDGWMGILGKVSALGIEAADG
jgi:hypothetical protein